MSNPITEVQERYLAALAQNMGKRKFKELKRQLKIESVPISELTKDEAYHLITKVITESSGEVVAQALATALEKETA